GRQVVLQRHRSGSPGRFRRRVSHREPPNHHRGTLRPGSRQPGGQDHRRAAGALPYLRVAAERRSPVPDRRSLMRARVGLILLLSVLAVSPAGAQTEGRPVLADHQFVSTDLVPDAFVRPSVRSDLGAALAGTIHYPPLLIAGDTLQALDGSLSYARLDAEYQQELRDWMAVRFAYGLRTRIGTRLSSLVSEGVTVASGFEFGWLVRLHQSHRTSLVGSLAVSSQYITIVDVKQFAEDVANRVPDARLIDLVPTVRSNGGLRLAWAISKQFGTTFVGEGSYGESPRRRDADSWEYNFGASVDFDGRAAWNI